MKKLDLQSSYIYGPLHSRRLGVSLGVNLSPVKYKLCSFDCIYCQYGFTDKKVLKTSMSNDFPEPQKVIDELLSALKQAEEKSVKINYITFAGNGEPTVHPKFCEIANKIFAVRDKIVPSVKTAVLSNASCVSDPNIRKILAKFDDAIIKLDAGDENTFKKINRPHTQVKFFHVVSALKSLDNITLQTLFVEGRQTNSSDEQIDKLIDCYNFIKPQKVQIYSLDRVPAEHDLKKVSQTRLNEIRKKIVNKLPGLNVTVY
ncbi:radical SAM protein [bacterium]|nr:radical SAM protein [bacterium]